MYKGRVTLGEAVRSPRAALLVLRNFDSSCSLNVPCSTSSVAQDTQLQGFSNDFSTFHRKVQRHYFRDKWESDGSVWKVRLFLLPSEEPTLICAIWLLQTVLSRAVIKEAGLGRMKIWMLWIIMNMTSCGLVQEKKKKLSNRKTNSPPWIVKGNRLKLKLDEKLKIRWDQNSWTYKFIYLSIHNRF